MQFSQQVEQVQPPPITEVKSWLNGRKFPSDKPLIDLCQAIPNYSPPSELVEHLKQTLDDPLSFKYSPDEGLPEVRKEVSSWYLRRYQAAPKAEQICLTIGASQAFWLAICSICQAGDEVIVQLPAYFDHPMALQALGIKPVFAPFDPADAGLPDNHQIEQLITKRTRAILLVTPSNPTGAVIPHQQIEQLFKIAQKHNIALILDETYNAFIDAPPHKLFGRNDWGENFIHIASFGKTFALTGLRCGALVASKKLIEQALKIQDSMAVCQPRPAQLALEFGCNKLNDWVNENCRMMQKRHDQFRNSFISADHSFELVASGSFFAWIKHPWPQLNSRQAARKLADDANLICLPGEAFGPGLSTYLRLAFGNISDQHINSAVERFRF
ncbi:hypothetical protein SAMN02745165_00179 [Malonomonas rubra DSM 5091]|uniref:Aminotransferase class I/classII large domain-containing protein n=1 Tax=Malonomonas rubra DSM 5091 TaxID=1122189 RepID=A0A1M6BH63_MALRU|nr:aminotransferase [Malonomonas rubra]SHI48062.1 hypothetical protein SAMN02745165_00179 [Malonomonas rubra DSM 5091]